MDLCEPVADAVIAYLKAGQDAKLAVVEARYVARPMRLRPFAAVRLSDPDREHEPEYPVLYVVPIEERLKAGAGGIGKGMINSQRYAFVVLAHNAGTADESPAESVKRACARYMVAILEMLAAHTDYEWGTGAPALVQYRTWRDTTTGEYLGMAALEIGIQRVEAAL